MQLSPLEVILRGKTGIVSTPDDYWVAGYFLGRCNKKKSRDRICSSCATDRIHCRTKKIVGVSKDKIGSFWRGETQKWCHLLFFPDQNRIVNGMLQSQTHLFLVFVPTKKLTSDIVASLY